MLTAGCSVRKRQRVPIVAVSGSATQRQVAELHGRLTIALAEHGSVSIDCRAATDVDLSAIQLLLAARKSAAAAGNSLTLRYPADGALHAALLRGGFLADPAEQAFWLKDQQVS